MYEVFRCVDDLIHEHRMDVAIAIKADENGIDPLQFDIIYNRNVIIGSVVFSEPNMCVLHDGYAGNGSTSTIRHLDANGKNMLRHFLQDNIDAYEERQTLQDEPVIQQLENLRPITILESNHDHQVSCFWMAVKEGEPWDRRIFDVPPRVSLFIGCR